MIAFPLAAAINHLLEQEAWARAKLARHAGKVALFDAGIISLRLGVSADGMVQAVPADALADVSIRAALADLPLMLQNRAHAFSHVRIEGDADFASTISQLADSLKWEAEHDLANVIGDVPAARLVSGARTLARGAQDTRRRVEENLAEYFLEEDPVLVRKKAVEDFSDEVTQLRDDIERLAKRVEKLEGRR